MSAPDLTGPRVRARRTRLSCNAPAGGSWDGNWGLGWCLRRDYLGKAETQASGCGLIWRGRR